MNAVIIGDLHLGSRYCHHERLLRFLDVLPQQCDLVLNGDVIDRYAPFTEGPAAAVLDRLRAESLRRRVLWLLGNHDRRRRPTDTGDIEFDRDLRIDRRLLVYHGDARGSVLFIARPLTALLRLAYGLKLKLFGEGDDVAAYAKRRWMFLYQIVRHDVRIQAAWRARRDGFGAVVCGHSHFPEQATLRGVRFLNPGAWTEMPVYAVWLTDTGIEYRLAAGADGVEQTPRGQAARGTQEETT